MLSSFSPYVFNEPSPAYPAAAKDWNDCVKPRAGENGLDVNLLYLVIIDLLTFYRDEFGFDIDWLVKELNQNELEAKQVLQDLMLSYPAI